MKTALIVFYPFLFLVIPILQLWYKNYTEVNTKDILKLILYFFAFYLLFFGVFAIFYKGLLIKQSLLITAFIYIFNKYLYFYTKMSQGKHLSTRIIGFFQFVIIVLSPFIIVFLPSLATSFISKVLISLAFIIPGVYSLGLTLNFMKLEKKPKELDDNITIKKHSNLPDIFYIIPDSYSGKSVLEKYYNFDNSDFLDWLTNKGFEVADNARPNYPITNVSISSTLNMDYLENFFNYDETISPEINLIKHYDVHYNNKVAKILQANGYKYYHIVNWWEKQRFSGVDIADEVVDIEKDAGIYEFVKVLFQRTIINKFVKRWTNIRSRKTLEKTFSSFEQIALNNSKVPKFVMMHLICPHPPFLYDKNGKLPNETLNRDNRKDHIKLYCGQLQYLNKKLKNVISKILKNKPNAVIIVMADHGGESSIAESLDLWQEQNKEFMEERYSILRAIYAKNICFYNIKTSVNIFRYLLNSILGESFSILPDKYMYCTYENRLITHETNEVD